MGKHQVFDLFAGAGGFSLGFNMTGRYDVTFAIEKDHWAVKTLKENKTDKLTIVEDDITNYHSKDQIEALSNYDQAEVIIGGPPCQGFSNAGPAYKKDPKDPRNSLFIDFARWVKYLIPKVFVMENVKGILTRQNANNEYVIDIVNKTFQNLDYHVEVWKLNAAEYGVPQLRERVFIVGHQRDGDIGPPKTTHYLPNSNNQHEINGVNKISAAVGVGEAIFDLPEIKAWEGAEEQDYTKKPSTDFQVAMRGDQQILYNHVAMKHTKRMVERFEQIKIGQSIRDVSEEYRAKKRNGNGKVSESTYNSNNRRLNSNSPSYTIPAQFYSSFIHPTQHRNITAREAARLQSFPDWYRFRGKRTVISRKLLEKYERHEDNYLSQYNQIGNAVPPLLAKAIAEHIKQFLD